MDGYLIAYIALVLAYGFAETAAITHTRTVARDPVDDWTIWLVVAPYWLVPVAPALSYLTRSFASPGIPAVVLGALLFAAAVTVRVRAYLDLAKQYAALREAGEERGLVTTGLYAHIRHPLYLANILMFIACPTFLAVGWPWIVTAVGIVGILVRISTEERALRTSFAGYEAYAKKTWRLIPRVY